MAAPARKSTAASAYTLVVARARARCPAVRRDEERGAASAEPRGDGAAARGAGGERAAGQ